MKKILVGALIVAATFALASCQNENMQTDGITTVEFTDNYFMSGISGVSLLRTNTNNFKRQALTDETKAEIIENFTMLEDMLGSQVVKSESLESDDPNYTYKYLVELNMLDGTIANYTYYYNERVIEQDYDETESIISGVVLVDGISYDLRGTRETESNETEIEYRIQEANGDYVLIEQENEYQEESFSYSKYEGGRKVLEFELEKETKGQKTEYEIKQKTGSNSYQYEILERGEMSLVEVKVRENGISYTTRFKITYDEFGNPNYEFIE